MGEFSANVKRGKEVSRGRLGPIWLEIRDSLSRGKSDAEHDSDAAIGQKQIAGRNATLINGIGLFAKYAAGVNPKRFRYFVELVYEQPRMPQSGKISWRGGRRGRPRPQSPVDRSRLSAVLESVDSGQLAIAAQRVGRIAMAITEAENRLVVPFQHPIQKAHQTGVWNKSADFRLLDRNIDLAGFG